MLGFVRRTRRWGTFAKQESPGGIFVNFVPFRLCDCNNIVTRLHTIVGIEGHQGELPGRVCNRRSTPHLSSTHYGNKGNIGIRKRLTVVQNSAASRNKTRKSSWISASNCCREQKSHKGNYRPFFHWYPLYELVESLQTMEQARLITRYS